MMMFTVPAESGGAMAVMVPLGLTVKAEAAVPPKSTPLAPNRLGPEMVTTVPPAVGPQAVEPGLASVGPQLVLTLLTCGAAAATVAVVRTEAEPPGPSTETVTE